MLKLRHYRPDVATVVGLGFSLWGLNIGLGRLADNSLFTHIATGRLILSSGIPRSDPYSFTAPGTPWVVQSWLASLTYGLLDRLGGVDGIRLLMGVSSALLAWLVWSLSRPAKTLVPRVVITGLVIATGAVIWSPRPLLFGLIFMALTLLAIDGRLPQWVLLPVFWLWVNTHGSFPLGIVAIIVILVGAHLDHLDQSAIKRGLGWSLGGVLLGVVNPLGPVIIWFPVRLLSRQEMLSNVIEWQSPSFATPWARLFLVQMVLAVLMLVRRPSYRTALPLIVFGAAALLGARNIAFASLVSVPGLAVSMEGLGSLTGRETGKKILLALGAVAVLAGLVLRSNLSAPGYDLSGYPVDALAFVEQSHWRTDDVEIATTETVGNYLTLLHGADARVFFDDRVDMYPESVMDDFMTLYRGRPGWSDVLKKWNIDLVVWESDAPLTGLLRENPRWRIVYDDKRWVVACDRESDDLRKLISSGGRIC